MLNRKRILICPLNWGLGHATRCIPVINALIDSGCEVVIGADKDPLALLQKEFPNLQSVVFPGVDIIYSKGKSSVFKLMLQLPGFIKSIKTEKAFLERIIKEHKIDAVISDNRYGVYADNIPSVLITHQLSPAAGILTKPVNFFLQRLINKFDEVWIPDSKKNNISGKLSKGKLKIPIHYLGVLSRFNQAKEKEKEIFALAIISGPEPQRSIFMEFIVEQFKSLNKNCMIIAGKPGDQDVSTNANITIYNHLPTEELKNQIEKADHIICRAGYSSVMDLIALQRNAILVPTPGQPEQEYLAKHLKEKGWFYYEEQEDLDIVRAIEKYKDYKLPYFENELELRIRGFIETLG